MKICSILGRDLLMIPTELQMLDIWGSDIYFMYGVVKGYYHMVADIRPLLMIK